MLSLHRPHTCYGAAEIDVTRALEAMAQLRRQHRIAVSLHAFVLHCMARAAAANPDVLTFRHGRRLVTFHDADVATVLDRHVQGVRIPVGYTLRAAQSKSLASINAELRAATQRDLATTREVQQRRRLARLPAWLRWLIVRRIGRNPHLLRQVQGTIGLTSIHRPGLDFAATAYPPNVFTLTLAIGGITRRAGPDGGMRRMLFMGGAMDHAVLDGAALARFMVEFAGRIEAADGLGDAFLAEAMALRGPA